MIPWTSVLRVFSARRQPGLGLCVRSLLPVLVLASAGVFMPAAEGSTPAQPAPALLRAQARAQIETIAAALPPQMRPSPELASAYVEAYVATRTQEIVPCGPPPAAGDGAPAPLLLGGPPSMVPAVPDSDTVLTWGLVFLDLDADSTYDAGEPGLENIAVSNGTQAGVLGNGVKLTEADGSFSFLTPLPDSRFVFVTVPSGYTATTPFFHRLTATSPDTAYFGLIETPETADPVFRWVQMSDMQVDALPQSGDELSADLTEIEQLPLPPDFIVITGDLVNTGSIDEQFQVFLNGVAGHPIRLRPGYGDHDASGDTPAVTKFEEYIGPTCYSFEHGGIHFILYNDIHAVAASGEFIQFGWLFQDITVARARDPEHSIPIVICKHKMPLVQEVNLYNQLRGVIGAFSGHWHGSRVRLLEGIFDVNTPPSRYAGIDKSSRGFRVNDMDNGEIETTYHLAGIDDQVLVATPADGDTVVAGQVAVRVNTYDSVDPVLSGTFVVDGAVSSGTVALASDGPWAWKGIWNAASAPDGDYTLTATLVPEAGSPIARQSTFTLVRAGVTPPDPHTDWPSFKHDPAGTGYIAEDLRPPLRVLWARHLGGRNNVESPVVAGGRVYVGTSNISTVTEAALNCFDAVSGNLLWRFPARTDVKSTPSVADGRVFFSNSIGTVFALDAVSGSLIWQAQLGDSLTRWEMTSPTVVGDKVYAGGLPAMSCLDAATGAVLWQRVGDGSQAADFIPSIYSAPAVSGNTVVFTTRAGIYAYDRISGAPLWQYTGSAHQHRSAAIVNGLVYTEGGVFGAQRLKAYDLATGQVVYSANYTQSESTAGPAVTPTHIIAVHGGNSQTGPANGLLQGWLPTLGLNLLWNFEVNPPIASSRPYQRITGSINSTPAVANTIAYFGADDGHLYAVDVATGAEIWRFDFGVPVRSSPAIAGNMLFVTAADGSLYAFVATTLETAGAAPVAAAPLRTRLLGNHPNPFNPSTAIAFDLGPAGSGPAPVTLRIYDTGGRLVRNLVDGPLPPGHHFATWDGRNNAAEAAASGVYFYRLEAGGQTFEERMVLVR